METNTNNINENEPIVDETIEIEETETIEAAEADTTDERPRGRGRHGRHGRRPFGPNRPYRFALFVEEDGSYVLRSPDLADRTAKVESLDGLGAALQTAIDERATEDAAAAAEAEKDAQFSGKFVLRLPRSMHRQLTELAEIEGVSLNQLALGFLAEGMGRAEMIQEIQDRRGKHRGPRGGHGPGGRGPEGRGPRGGWGPDGRGAEGREFEGRGPNGHVRRSQGGPEAEFGARFEGRGSAGRGPSGRGPWGRGPKEFGPRRRWFDTDVSSETPAASEPNEQSFV